jgi:hypothetical protein
LSESESTGFIHRSAKIIAEERMKMKKRTASTVGSHGGLRAEGVVQRELLRLLARGSDHLDIGKVAAAQHKQVPVLDPVASEREKWRMRCEGLE